jgi:pyruvate,water dikinase
MILIKTFEQITMSDTAIAGGKGASLGEMTQAGISVPSGFVILSNAFEKFLEETNLNIEIDSILHSVNPKEIHTIENASEKIKSLITSKEIPEDIKSGIQKYFKKLNTEFVAVRSSATAEDSSSAAWAGQLESYLNTTENNLLDNVKKCWASLFTPRAIFYRFEKELHKTKISVAVVIQKMVDSEISGIAFSVHPITQDDNQLVIEASFGLGEAIVSGQITPDSYVVEKKPLNIFDVNINTQLRGMYRGKNGGNEWKEISKIKGESQVLSDNQIKKLSKIILSIEKHYNFPCDIEWAFKQNKFYIVQSRPITTLGGEIQAVGEGKWLERGAETDIHLFPVVLHLNGVYLSKKVTGISIGTFLMFSRKNTVQYLIKPGTFIKAGKKILNLIKKDKKWIFNITANLEKGLDELLKSSQQIYETKLEEKSNIQLLRFYSSWSKDVVEMMKYGAIAPIVEWEESMLSEKLNKILSGYINKQNLNESLMGEYLSILSTPLKKLWMTKEQENIYKIAVKIISKRGVAELISKNDISLEAIRNEYPSIANLISDHKKKFHWIYFNYEGPEKDENYFVQILREILTDKNHIRTRFNELTKNIETVKKSQKDLIKKIKMSKEDYYLFKVAQEFSYQKGIRRDLSFKAYWQVTKLLEEISRRLLLTVEQVRNITVEEMQNYLIENKIDKKKLNERIKLCATLVRQEKFSYFSGKEANDLVKEIDSDLIIDKDVQELKGSVAYPGKVIGKVKIIQRKEDMSKMEKGDILVSFATNPELVPAMKKAGAIVTDEGGITCHAAIVSREMKIPCVIGTKNASKIFKDGDLVEVDAERGLVKIIKE